MQFTCSYCGKPAERRTGEVNRGKRAGLPLYCDRRCAGLARRSGKTAAQLKEEKRLYDIDYREKNAERLKDQKREYFHRIYDPVAAAEHRKTRMPAHVEYCRRPEYKRWKKGYDRSYRANRTYGDFAEAAMTLMDLTTEIKQRSTRYENDQQNGKLCKTQKRRRTNAEEPERGRGRKRDRDRRSSHSAVHS